jgi:hypothetical protein
LDGSNVTETCSRKPCLPRMAASHRLFRQQEQPRHNPGCFWDHIRVRSTAHMSTRTDPSPNEFYSAFLQVVNREKSALLDGWSSNPTHSGTMFGRVLPAVAEELAMRHRREFWWIDLVLYQERDQVHFPEPAWASCVYAKYVSVALEHENDHTYVADEMSKLQLANTPLTVLITYPQTDARATELLEMYAEIVRDADIFGNASTARRQLAIFGYRGPRWDAFIYSDGRFTPLILAAERSTSI